MGKQRKRAKKVEGPVLEMVKCMGTVIQRALLLPPLFLMLVICFWVMTSLLPVTVFHVCISSRRLKVHCVSVSSTRFAQQPVVFDDDKTSPGRDEEIHGFSVASHGLKNVSTLRNKSVDAHGVLLKREIPTAHADISSQKKFGNMSNEMAIMGNQTIDPENATYAHNARDEEIHGFRVATHGLKNVSPLLNKSVNADGLVLKQEIPTAHVEISSQEKFGNMSNEMAVMGNESIDAENATYAHNVAKVQIEAIRSASMPAGMKDPSQKQCRGRQIYVYDLPKKFNAELLEQCDSLIPWFDLCDYVTNGGMGKPIENFYQHWHETHQYALELAFHSRISKHPCLVSNPEEGNLFYIPYYGGLDVLRWNFRRNISSEKRDELSVELVNWLQGQTWWKRHGGRDHVLVLGKISWDFRRSKNSDQWGNRLLLLPEMQLVTKLLIERHPWDMNEIGVPHPTFFHPRSDEDIWHWQWQISTSQRPHLISFAGAPRPNSTESIRSILIEQCLGRPEACKFLDCNTGVCLRPESTVKLFMKSEFCFQPPGDSPTRRSVFDSLIAGCIPVMFNPFTAYYQYPWHLPANESSYSVYIPEETVRQREINVVEALQKIPGEQRKEMRRTIIQEIMPGLVYGDPDSRFVEFQDAFMISLNNILWRLEKASISTNSSKNEAI